MLNLQPRWTTVFFILIAVIACSKSTAPAGGSDTSDCQLVAQPGSANAGYDATGAFTISPLDETAGIRYIYPMGNIVAPGHTYPSDHMYFYMALVGGFIPAANTVSVRAAASGTVVAINSPHNNGVDYRIYVSVDQSLQYYYDHVSIADGIAVGSSVTAGQTIATNSGSSGAVDFGVENFNHTSISGIIDTCLQMGEKWVDSPLKYYSGSLQSTLYSKVQTTSTNKDGTVGFDVAGELIGAWVQEGATNSLSGANQQLEFAFDVSTPTSPLIGISGTILSAGNYGTNGDPAFTSVTTSSGTVTFHLTNYGNSTQLGLLLVKMLTDTRIEIEYFPGSGLTTASFDANALYYVR